MRIGVLASGSGTNLAAILAARLPVAVTVVDRECGAIAISSDAGIPVEIVPRGDYLPDRTAFTHAIVDALERHDVQLVAMAGFMTILDKPIFDAFPNRIINTHPSLLPAFRGAHSVEDALAAGVKLTGCTIHVAVPEVDAGPILAQEAVAVRPDDTAATLHERIKAVEHRLYPQVLAQLVQESS